MSELSPPERPERPGSPVVTRILPLVATPDPSDQATGPASDNPLSSGVVRRMAEQGGILADFELMKELGRGGMGIVYKARQKSLDRLVAVKMLLGDPAQNPVVLSRFRSEARSAAALTHPNIVAVYQIGECSDGHYFVMEYVKGPTLQTVLDRQSKETFLPVNWAVNLMLPVVDAVHHAHTKGIIHRDLKPANIMIDRANNRPVVLDFGIARRLDEPAGLTRAGVVIGTPSYMPPEQAGEAGGVIGPASDVYALGAILYRVLTGRLPYEAETALATLLMVAGPEMPPSVRTVRPDVPKSLSDICMKCLNKKAANRYASAEELGRQLQRFLKRPHQGKPEPEVEDEPADYGPSVVLVSERTGEQFRLSQPANVIGRASDCDVVIKKSDVSKRHCRILVRADGAVVEDLDSVNGTSVNGASITRQPLEHGDVLTVAEYAFRVRLELPEQP